MWQNFKSSFGMVFTVFSDMQVFFNYTGSNLEAKYKCAEKYLDVWLCVSALMAVCSLKAVFNFLKSEESGQPIGSTLRSPAVLWRSDKCKVESFIGNAARFQHRPNEQCRPDELFPCVLVTVYRTNVPTQCAGARERRRRRRTGPYLRCAPHSELTHLATYVLL